MKLLTKTSPSPEVLNNESLLFKHNLKIFISFGILFELMNTLFNPYAIKYLERIGGTDFDISLFTSMKGFIMIFVVLPGVFLLNRVNDKKHITSQVVLVSVWFVLSLVIVPFIPAKLQPFIFILLMTLMTIPSAIYNVAYQDLIGDLFPIKRPEVIAKRSMHTIVYTTLLTLASGFVFKLIPKSNSDVISIYQIFYLSAFFVGMIAYFRFKQFVYTPNTNRQPLAFKGSFKTVFSNKRFTKFVTASTIFHFGWQMGWPLFSIYMIKNLGADEFWLSLISIGSAIAMFMGHKIWPKMIAKYGNERITTICAAGMAITPIIYALSPNLMVLLVISSASGLFVAGTVTVLFADMLTVTPEENRIIYVGYYNTLTNITLAISPFFANFFLSHYGIYVALYVTAAFRMVGCIAFLLREKSEHRQQKTKSLG